MLYPLLRRSCLTLALAALLLLPVWHLRTHASLDPGYPVGTMPAVVGTLWSVEVLGIEWMDPLAGASALATGRGGAGILVALIPTVLAVVLLGRFFCGWLCPYVPLLAASNAIRSTLAGFGFEPPDKRLGSLTPFAVLLAVLLLTAAGGAVIAPLIYPPAIIGRQLFRLVYFGGWGMGVLVVAGAFAFDTFVSRAGFCTYLCPGGALFRVLGLASPVRVKRDARVCDSCGACDLACSLDQSPMTDGLDSGCERCAKCVAACPCDALRVTVDRPVARLFRRRVDP